MRGLSCIAILIAAAGCSGTAIPIGDNSGITAAHCRNGALDADETDVDCGGKDCVQCALGKGCGKDLDCTSGSCQAKVCGKACGGPCTFANGVGQCQGGQCVLVSCEAGFGDCNRQAFDGCEIDLSKDAANCGGCGTSCLLGPQVEACVAGVCQPAPQNQCGGIVCAPPHATGKCVNNACTIAACDAGYGDCNRRELDGCEVALASDALNCGGCGVACRKGEACMAGKCGQPCQCQPQHGVGQCINGICTLISCDNGFGDCNRDPRDGCEVDLTSDPKDCGACGNACPPMKACARGACI